MPATRLLYDNECIKSGVVITASSEVTNYPAANLANPARWKIWRSATNTSSQNVVFDLLAAKTLKHLFLMNWTQHTGGSIKVQANATDSWGSPTIDETLTLPSFNPTKLVGAFVDDSLRYVRVLFSNDTSANEYVELGVCSAGDYIQPTNALTLRYDIEPIDPSLIVRAEGGQAEAHQKDQFHSFSGEFVLVPEADKDNLLLAFATVGTHTPFLFVCDPADVDLIFYGRFNRGLPLKHLWTGAAHRWTIPIEFVEDV